MSINIKGRTVYGPNIATDGLVFYLDAANIKSYPGSGTTWYDLSESNDNSTLYNGITYSNGNMIFNGYNNYARADIDLSTTNTISICCWLKYSHTAITLICEHSVNFNTNNSFGIVANETGVSGCLEFVDHTSAGYNVVYTANAYNDNNWHYLCATSNRSLDALNQSSLYIDGISDKIQKTQYCANNNENYSNFTMYIGSRAGTSFFTPMSLSIIKIYNRVLLPTEVLQNYNAMKGRYV